MATEITTETVTYAAQGTTLKGYRAAPASGGNGAGVLVFHEWWGLNDYIRGRAERLAELGYVALAADMYGDGKVAADPQEAGSLMNGVLGDVASADARLRAAIAQLQSDPGVADGRIGAIGYCFGGAIVLHAARSGMDVAAVVSFHGALGAMRKATPGSVKARVLVCHGAADVLVPEADLAAFREEMTAAGADYRVIAYDGAKHGFTNPGATERGEKYGLPLAYDAAVDARSWVDMQAFFEQSLK